MFNIFKKENEDLINREGNFPHNIIPKGYPYKISSKKIKITINYFLENMISRSNLESKHSFIERDRSFIELGRTELNNRSDRKKFLTNIIISLTALIISIIALFSN